MAFRKYANDFRLEVEQRPGKKPKTVPVYIGPRFVYCTEDDRLRKLRRYLPLCAFPAAACFLISLLLNSSIVRQIYVLLPYFCSFLPYCYLCGAVGGFLLRQTPYTREQNDKIPGRIRSCTVALLALSCYSLAASAVCLILHRQPVRLPHDVLFLILLAAQAAMSLLLFRRRAALNTRELTK